MCIFITGTGQKIEFEEATEFSNATALLENASEVIHSLENGDVRTVTKRSNLHAFTVALALSVHSIFEGLALGLEEQTSQVRNSIYQNQSKPFTVLNLCKLL